MLRHVPHSQLDVQAGGSVPGHAYNAKLLLFHHLPGLLFSSQLLIVNPITNPNRMPSTDLPPVFVSSKRYSPNSFSDPLLSRAPFLERDNSDSSLCCYRDSTSSFYVTLPSSDLERSQYLWPSTTIKLDNVASNRHMREEYKARLRKQFECSNTFRQQFLLFVGQLMHDQAIQKPSSHFPSLTSPRTFQYTPYTDPSLGLVTASETELPSLTVPPKDGFRHRPSILLIPPQPRLTSPLSPFPSYVPLMGPLRRPMPPSKGSRVCLLKQALCNAENGRQMKNVGTHVTLRNFESQSTSMTVNSEDVTMEYTNEKLNKSWVDVSSEDWEMIEMRELPPVNHSYMK